MLTCIGILFAEARAETLNSDITKVILRNIENIRCAGYEIESYFGDSKSLAAKLIIFESDERFRVSYREYTPDDGGIAVEREELFDGTRRFRYFPLERLVNIQKVSDALPTFVRNYPLLLSPYEFAFADHGEALWTKNEISLIAGLKADSITQRVLSFEEALFQEKQCLVLYIKGGRDRFIDMEVVYKVYLDPNLGYFPIAWESRNLNGQLISELEVLKTERIGTDAVVLPSELIIKYYALSNDIISLTPTNSQRIKYSNIVLNSIEELDFSPDLTKADHIFDADRKIWFNVWK